MPRVTNQPAMAVVPRPVTARLRVALLLGCVAHQIRPSIAAATVNVLHRNGIEVIPLPEDTCCGALALHSGDFDAAVRTATAMCRAIEESRVDFVVTTAAGCGAMVRKFDDLFLPQNACFDAAVAVSRASRDICELLVEIGIRPPDLLRASERIVAYHDACHLLHGCGVHAQPRALLSRAGIRWRDLPESTICCGSAGVYNLLHPEAASQLGRRKAELIVASGASDVAVGNIGCMMQLELALSRENHRDIAVWHPVELLDAAYRENDLL